MRTSRSTHDLVEQAVNLKAQARLVLFCLLALLMWSAPLSAQQVVWSEVEEASILGVARQQLTIEKYRTYALNIPALMQVLATAPMEFTVEARLSPVEMTLPMPDGTLSRFHIVESPMMEPELAAKYPDIKTYSGQGIDDPTATTRFDWTPNGFNAIILSEQGTVYVAPYATGDLSNYISFFSRDLPKDAGVFKCLVQETGLSKTESGPQALNFTSGDQLRTYRLAVAATGEFTQAQEYGNGSVATALGVITTIVNGVNAIYEQEAAIRFQLINNENAIIFTNPATDPYTNSDNNAMLDQNQAALDQIIGTANYDLGHVFGYIQVPAGSFSFSGLAQLGAACVTGEKGRGASRMGGELNNWRDPIVSGVAHEFGHQFNANHTFNGTTNSCGGNNRSPQSAYEPGSGSTIMSYNGSCGDENLQPNDDLYFHNNSLEQIINWAAGTGNCAAQTATGNRPPTIAALANFTIPRSTPFTLTATANDPDGDALTYTWEEYDLGDPSPPHTDNGNRPIFRSYKATPSNSRSFPSLQYILNNANNPPPTYTVNGTTYLTGETLPTTNRTMNFRVTARDNRAGGGGVQDASMQVTISAGAGPFQVTQPNTAVTWTGNSSQTVTWNVANTNANPVNATAVRISLSTDGGQTFTTLLANTPNDGSETVIIPNSPTTSARIKVEAVGNIFFDVSNVNFTIQAGTGATIAVSAPGAGATWTVGTQQTVSWTSAGVTGNVNIKLSTDGGTTFPITVAANTANDGSESITVPNNPSTTCRVRVESAANTNVFGVNPGNFTIQAPTVALNPPTNLTASVAGNTVTLNWQPPATAAQAMAVSDQTSTLQVFTRQKSSASARRQAVQFANNATPQTVIQEVEPNNTVAQAQVLTGASPLEVNGNAEVNDAGAVVLTFTDGSQDDLEDLYLVTTTAQGLKINLDGFTSDCDVYLRDATGTTAIDFSNNVGATTPEQIDQPNLAAGTYLIGVTIYDPAPLGGPTTAYKLTVTGQFGGGGATLLSYNIYRSTSSPVPITLQNQVGNVNANTTTFNDMNVPGGTHFYVVTAVYDQGESGPSNQASAQVGAAAITVSAPAGGATWTVGTQQTVSWTSTGVTGNINIKLSTDGGTSFPITLAANTANDGSESVTVPNNPSTTCRVRVESAANPGVFGVNPGNYTIQAPTVALNPPTNLTASVAGNTVTLNWQPPATAAQAMAVSDQTSTLQVFTRQTSSASARRQAVQFANNAAPQTVIQEVEPNNTVAQAQVLTGASPLEVNGNAEVNDAGAVVLTFTDGSQDDLEDLYLVTTTAQGLKINLDGFTSDCDVYLRDATGTTAIDFSNNVGATTPEQIDQPNLAAGTYLIGVTIYDPAPLGGPTSAYKLTVTGQFGGGGATLQSYNIYRSTLSPVPITPQNRVGNVNANTTTFNDMNVPGGTHFYVATAVYDQGESGPSNQASAQVGAAAITVSAPAGGATWTVGTQQTVSWTSTGVTGNVNVKLSTDGGTSFPITLAANTANDGSESVTVPNNPSTTCRVRVESAANTSVFGVNPGNFTIQTAGNCQLTWQVDLTVRDAGGASETLGFGRGPTATNDLDAACGEQDLPPPPPLGVFDARFELPVLPKTSRKDYRSDAEQMVTWRMKFQPGTPGTITFSWNPAQFPSGSIFLKDEITGTLVNVDMKTQNNFPLTQTGITSLKIEYSREVSRDVSVSSGWNIVSVPLTAANMSVSSLFPDAASPAFEFNNGYIDAATLANGKGYWIKFNNAGNYRISGLPVATREIQVKAGWNIIGPFESDVPVSAITSVPANIVESSYFGYSNGYIDATTLTGGKGYWVKVSQQGVLVLSAPAGNATAIMAKASSSTQGQEVDSAWPQILIEDSNGNTGTLYLAPAQEIGTSFELPPMPPAGIFDVRFTSGQYVESLDGSRREIQISSAQYPIRITAKNLQERVIEIEDMLGGNVLSASLAEDKEILVTTRLEKIVVAASKLPAQFALSQNYPNPFNPTTLITFALPKKTHVKITVFNILGEKVATLVNQEMEAGYQQVQLDARGYASGLYFYMMEAGDFKDLKKMVIAK